MFLWLSHGRRQAMGPKLRLFLVKVLAKCHSSLRLGMLRYLVKTQPPLTKLGAHRLLWKHAEASGLLHVISFPEALTTTTTTNWLDEMQKQRQESFLFEAGVGFCLEDVTFKLISGTAMLWLQSSFSIHDRVVFHISKRSK